MNIGQLAREAGVPIDTVRYYERNGLLPEPARRASGYRNYQSSDVDRLRFVRRAKSLGFSLSEIRELLALSDRRGEQTPDLQGLAQTRMSDVDRKLAELTRLRAALQRLTVPGQDTRKPCPLLHALTDPDR
jgi:MerR family copper efflux transcriptional regulator